MNKQQINDDYLNNYIVSIAERFASAAGALEAVMLTENYEKLNNFQRKNIALAACNLNTASHALHDFFKHYEDSENKQGDE